MSSRLIRGESSTGTSSSLSKALTVASTSQSGPKSRVACLFRAAATIETCDGSTTGVSETNATLSVNALMSCLLSSGLGHAERGFSQQGKFLLLQPTRDKFVVEEHVASRINFVPNYCWMEVLLLGFGTRSSSEEENM